LGACQGFSSEDCELEYSIRVDLFTQFLHGIDYEPDLWRQIILMDCSNELLNDFFVPLILDERDIWMALGGGSRHRAMIPLQ
jgi:hypothetical protein